jgi:hypothetical protein
MSKSAPISIGMALGAHPINKFFNEITQKIQSNGKNVYNYKMV